MAGKIAKPEGVEDRSQVSPSAYRSVIWSVGRSVALVQSFSQPVSQSMIQRCCRFMLMLLPH